jgi:hypothetical protein
MNSVKVLNKCSVSGIILEWTSHIDHYWQVIVALDTPRVGIKVIDALPGPLL